MSTEKPRITITLTEELLQEVDNYRKLNKIRSQSKAINKLIDSGISVLFSENKEEPVTVDGLGDDERRFIEVWRDLTPSNQRLLLEIGAVILRSQETPAD